MCVCFVIDNSRAREIFIIEGSLFHTIIIGTMVTPDFGGVGFVIGGYVQVGTERGIPSVRLKKNLTQ